jgi:hypothetical protein
MLHSEFFPSGLRCESARAVLMLMRYSCMPKQMVDRILGR